MQSQIEFRGIDKGNFGGANPNLPTKKISLNCGQTGKHVVRADDLPRASKLPCAQRPMTRAEFEKYWEATRG